MRILRSLLFVLLAPLAGCLEMEQTVTIAADGSGTQQLKMGIRETTLNDLVRASSAAQLGAARSSYRAAIPIGAPGRDRLDSLYFRRQGELK